MQLTYAVRLIVSISLPLIVGGLSSIATARGVQEWYPSLSKPTFNPPAWVFGPVWTLLYIMMGVAAFIVWQKGWNNELVRVALALYLVQLLLNGLWSILFFGMQAPGLAFVEIVVLWFVIAATIIWFWRVSPVAGILLMPYEAWVSFAMVLNGSLWILNR